MDIPSPQTPAARRDRAPAYLPADLAEALDVNELLTSLGLGPLDESTVRSVMGRNDNWIGRCANGQEVFVKRLHESERPARISRTERIARAGADQLRMPRLLGVSVESGLVVFELLPQARSGLDLANADEFTMDLAHQAGRQLAALHRLDPTDFDHSDHPLPPTSALHALSLGYYLAASSAELEMWMLLQRDTPVAEALNRLRAADRQGVFRRTPIHGDFRLDQLLVSDGIVHLTDFEEARVGDPARDIGAFAGEWLYLTGSALPTRLASILDVGQSATHDLIRANGVSELERRRRWVSGFVESYLHHRPEALEDDDLFVRASSYAGWHMLDRMLASAVGANRLSPVTKATAGFGRTLLLSPDEFVGALGLAVAA